MSLPQGILDMLNAADEAKSASDAAASVVKSNQVAADEAAATLRTSQDEAALAKSDLQAKVDAAVKALKDYFAGTMQPMPEARKAQPTARPVQPQHHR